MHQFAINRQTCDRDGLCMRVCPVRIIREDAEGYPEVLPSRAGYCIGCGQCFAFCPRGAVVLDGVSAAESPKAQRGGPEHLAAFAALARSRRSIRHYRPEPVAPEQLDALLETTRHAPTGSNRQGVGWVLVSDPANLDALREGVLGWMREELARDSQLAARMNLKGVIRACEAGKDIIFRGAPHVAVVYAGPDSVTPDEDCHIALTHLELAVAAAGLGACWIGFLDFAKDSPAVRELLGLEPEEHVYGALILGRPAVRFSRVPPRKPLKLRRL